MNDEQRQRPVIVSIPHASSVVPPEIADQVSLSPQEILHFTDVYTDRIYTIPNVHLVVAECSRIFVDVNRAPDDISREYEKAAEGVSVLTTWDGGMVYKTKPSQVQAEQLIKKYHDPYHQKIDELIPNAQFLFDGHSYLPVGPKLKPDSGRPRPDINIGNMNYSTCSREHTIFVRDFFEALGYSVAINFPYAGKYILGHHCHRRRMPPFLVPGIQLEINQKLYLNSEMLMPMEDSIAKLRSTFADLVSAFSRRFFPDAS